MTERTYFSPPDLTIKKLYNAVEVAEALRTLGLITDEQYEAGHVHVDQAEAAQGAAHSSKFLDDEVDAIVNAVSDTGEINAQAIREQVARRIPEQSIVVRVCESLYIRAVREAVAALVPADADYAGVLNEQYEALVNRTLELATELKGVVTAEQAIRAAKHEQWAELEDLEGTYSWLNGIVGKLRDLNRLPYSKPHGLRWKLKRPIPNVNVGDRGRFVNEILAGPYVPATEAEAEQTRKAHE